MSQGMPESDETLLLHHTAREAVSDAMARLGISRSPLPASESTQPRRGFESGPVEPGTGTRPRAMALVDVGNGALEWRDPDLFQPQGAPRRAFGDLATGAQLVDLVPTEDLGPNQIVGKLTDWDLKLTPTQGLRRWTLEKGFEPITSVPSVTTNSLGESGRILLFVHGTFSNNDAIFGQLQEIESAGAFLHWASSRYEQILAFDHPTLSVSPVLNGMDLTRLFSEVRAPVDVICHSRGGLVVRWWLEAFAGASVGPRRVVFVAAPLGGTSLASPAKLRDAFNLFTTVGTHLSKIGAAVSVFAPFMSVAVGLMNVFVAVTGFVANTPMADLFFSAIPGLGGMSRVNNNNELERLQTGSFRLAPYFAIRSDFQMERAGWQFWKNFQNLQLRTANFGASLIFDQANDLVVDSRAMIELFKSRGLVSDRVLDFGTNGNVYHTNYFLQPRVTEAFRKFLS
jgi:hypothetical protein